MRTWKFIVLGCAGLLLAGCRTDPAIVMLERDNYKKERQIDQLKWRIQDLEEALQGASAPGPVTVRTVPQSEAASAAGPDLGSALGTRPETQTAPPAPRQPKSEGGVVPPPDSLQGIPQLQIDVPGEPARPGTKPGQPQSRRDSGPRGNPTALVDNARVAQITVSKPVLAATDAVGLVVEPRDVRGYILDAPGEINVVALDPGAAGQAARVGRWDFNSTETAGMLRGGPDRGIHLNLTWPAQPPAPGNLRLFVRYTTRDGRKLQVEQPITVSLASARPSQWQPMKERPPEEPPPVRTASRPPEPKSDRPVWSPERH